MGDRQCSIPATGSTIVPAKTVPYCLRHDVVYDTLRYLQGDPQEDRAIADTELDKAWNPRNKDLADMTIGMEGIRVSCDPTQATSIHEAQDCAHSIALAQAWTSIIRTGPTLKTFWPVTDQDRDHAQLEFNSSGNIATTGKRARSFVSCLPATMDPRATQTASTLNFDLRRVASCVEEVTGIGTIPIEKYRMQVETTSDLWLDFLHEAQTATDHWGPEINLQIWNGGMTMSRHTDLTPTSTKAIGLPQRSLQDHTQGEAHKQAVRRGILPSLRTL